MLRSSTPRARLTALLGTAVAAVVALTVLPTAAQAAPKNPPARAGNPGAAFGIQPATKGKPDARSELDYSVTPGGTVIDQVAVVNLAPRPIRLRLYSADATTSIDGSFTLSRTGGKPVAVGRWLTVRHAPFVTVPGRTKRGPSHVIVPIQLTVPQNAQPGDHAGGVVVSLRVRTKNKKGVAVLLDQRVGLRVYLRVSGPLHPGLTVSNLHVGYSGPAVVGNPLGTGSALVTYTVSNTGNVALGAHQSVTMDPWLGSARAAVGLAALPALLPGTKIDVTARVPDVFPGVHLSADVHLVPTALPGAADPHAPAVDVSSSLWAIPWLLLAIVVVLLAVIVFATVRWLRRRKRADAVPPTTRHRRSRKPVAAGVAGMVVVAAGLLVAPAAHAATVPFTDTGATGQLTLCDSAGHAMDHGSVATKPFAWRAVGSQPAPQGYGVAGRVATLFAFQPIQNVDPSFWNGQQLTAAAEYTSLAHPMAAAVPIDQSLADYLRVYTPKWDGLIQLREILGAPGQSTDTSNYNAAVIRVTGDTWTLVSGSMGNCGSGKSTSTELRVPRIAALPAPATDATTVPAAAYPRGSVQWKSARKAAKAAAHAQPSSGTGRTNGTASGTTRAGRAHDPSSSASAGPGAASATPDPSDAAGAASDPSGGTGSSSLTWVVVLVLGVGLLGGVVWWRYRLTTAP